MGVTLALAIARRLMFQDAESVPDFVKDAAKHLPGGVRKLENFNDSSETLVFARQLEGLGVKTLVPEQSMSSFKAKVGFSQTPPWTAPRIARQTGNPGKIGRAHV